LLTDPIADYLTRVRNGLAADRIEVDIPASKLKVELSRILKEQGYISDYAVEPTAVGEVIKVQLRYTEARRPVITGIQRVSRPGLMGGMGTAILSTSSGVMTGHEAKNKGVGGEVVAYIW
jgi:small subunit ribosomal protein S8